MAKSYVNSLTPALASKPKVVKIAKKADSQALTIRELKEENAKTANRPSRVKRAFASFVGGNGAAYLEGMTKDGKVAGMPVTGLASAVGIVGGIFADSDLMFDAGVGAGVAYSSQRSRAAGQRMRLRALGEDGESDTDTDTETDTESETEAR